MHYATYASPLGKLLLASCGDGLSGLWLDRDCPREETGDAVLERAMLWLDGYFRGEDRKVDFPLSLEGTAFQKLVWKLLLDIPWGEVRTYGDLSRQAAAILEKENMSAQAVGQAVGANPIAIIIPCHRVVGANGKLGGYAYGTEKKQWLLWHEAHLKEETK